MARNVYVAIKVSFYIINQLLTYVLEYNIELLTYVHRNETKYYIKYILNLNTKYTFLTIFTPDVLSKNMRHNLTLHHILLISHGLGSHTTKSRDRKYCQPHANPIFFFLHIKWYFPRGCLNRPVYLNIKWWFGPFQMVIYALNLSIAYDYLTRQANVTRRV